MTIFNTSQDISNNLREDTDQTIAAASNSYEKISATVDSNHSQAQFSQTTGIILAGGRSRRMGQNKALLEIEGISIIERTFRSMNDLFSSVILVTNTPDQYSFLPCPSVPDIYPNAGSIAGLHAGLCASSTDRIFVVPCDMPFLNLSLIKDFCSKDDSSDALVPISSKGIEPLHACYRSSCIDVLESALNNGEKQLLAFLRKVRTRYISVMGYQNQIDIERSFCNLNHPQEYENLRPYHSEGNLSKTSTNISELTISL